MNPIVFAMRHPITTLILVVALISGGVLATNRMRVDIFPSLNTPRIYVFLQFGGMSPAQMEDLIVNQFELLFQYVDNVKAIESRSIQQVSLLELSFVPSTDMGQAMGQVVAMSDRAMSLDAAGDPAADDHADGRRSVPVGYLVLRERQRLRWGRWATCAQNVIRPLVQKNVPGTVAISPFGPNMRSIVINVDPQKLLDYNLTPQTGHRGPGQRQHRHPGRQHLRQGLDADRRQQRDGRRHPEARRDPAQAGGERLPARRGDDQDDTDITYGYALVNGKKSVYLPIIKKDTGSTLTVVADIRKSMQLFQRRGAQGRQGQLRVRRVAHGAGRRPRAWRPKGSSARC